MSLKKTHRIILNGDCIDVMRRFKTGSIPLIVTSPPYNLRNTSGHGPGSMWKNAAILEKGYSDHEDNMPRDDYIAWQRSFLTQAMRVLKSNGAIFYNHKNRVQNGLLQGPAEILEGFPVRQIITWKRTGGINFNRSFFLPTTEQIYLIANRPFKLVKGANKLTDVWNIKQEQKNPHPAPFPVELARRCIASTDADLVLDPFMGSGTTAVAAEELGRNYIGIEKSRDYTTSAVKRILQERKLNQQESCQSSLQEAPVNTQPPNLL